MIVGTRGGELALRQTQLVRRMLVDRGMTSISLKVLRTADDVLSEAALEDSESGGFSREALESALLTGEIDLAVFSLAWLPPIQSEGLVLGAVPHRGERREFVIIQRAAWEERAPLGLRADARLGVLSLRSRAQLLELRPDIEIVPLQGDVAAQLRRLSEKRLDGVMLPGFHLELLEMGLHDFLVCKVPLGQIVPKPGQGALAVLCREYDIDAVNACEMIHNPQVGSEVEVEKQILLRVQGAGDGSLAACCERQDSRFHVWVFLGAEDNPRGENLRENFIAESAEEAISVACDFLGAGGSAQL